MGTRKNQSSLTPAERAAFVAAVKALKASGAYDVFVTQQPTRLDGRQIFLPKMHAVRTDCDGEIDAIVDHYPHSNTSGNIYRVLGGVEELAGRCELVAQLDERGAPVGQASDLFRMREPGYARVGYRVDPWKLEAGHARAFIMRKQSSPLL